MDSNIPRTRTGDLNCLVPVTTTAAPPQPPSWDQSCNQAIQSLDRFIKIKVEPFTAEYRVLADLVHSAPNLEVTGIQRVVNVHLWKQFLDMRDYLLRSKSDDLELLATLGLNDAQIVQQFLACVNFNANKTIPSYADNVALLMHCTDGSVDSILSEGLDERLSSDSGHLGRGIYFTDNPSKAADYDNNNVFIVCAVLLGDCCQVMGRKPYVRGQEKTDSQKRHKYDGYFDSIVGCPATPDNEFVIYDRRQCVPIYLIRYRKKTKPASTSVRSNMYAEARRNYPPFSWNPAQIQNQCWGHGLITSPPVFVPARVNRWPFFALTIFGLMSQSDATTPKALQSTDNMAQLRSMGFTNDHINTRKLAQNNNDLNRTVEALLNLNQSPRAPASGQPQNLSSAIAQAHTFAFGPTSAPARKFANPLHHTNGSSASRHQLQPSASHTPFHQQYNKNYITLKYRFQNNPLQFHNLTQQSALDSFPPFNLDLFLYNFPAWIQDSFFHLLQPLFVASPPLQQLRQRAALSVQPRPPPLHLRPVYNPFRPFTAAPQGFVFIPTTMTGLFGTTTAAVLPAQNQTLTIAPAQLPSSGSTTQQQEECWICRDEPTSWITLLCCSQKICNTCFAQLETSGTTMSGFTCTFVKCPFCKRVVDGIEIGTCPDGEMTYAISNRSLDGHHGYGTIAVCYWVSFRAWNLHRIGYLPNSPEGNRALNLLKIAWDRRLVFSIGTSRTTGQSNVLVWNIHHKTGTSGGVQNHAYPDPTYLDRLFEELKQYGIQ